MFTERAKNTSFHKVSENEWKETVLKSLNISSMEKLYNNTYESIRLSPIYSKKDIKQMDIDQLAGEGSFVRGFTKKSDANWRIAQRISASNWQGLKKALSVSVKNGQDTISLNVDQLEELDKLDFNELNEIGRPARLPLFILTNSNFHFISDKLLKSHINRDVEGAVCADILSSQLSNGFLIDGQDEHFYQWVLKVQKLHESFPKLRKILMNTSLYHEAGASAVQELGIALALGVFYIEEMKKSGWNPAKTISNLIVNFSIGRNFFMEIAKLRAFRKLWKTIGEAYGIAKGEDLAIPISAETSLYTKSKLDPYVNILRGGNEAFAAVLGGVDYLHVTPFDELLKEPNEFSTRLARNTQLLLREEAYLSQFIDPAGGSYYVESLTDSLVEKGWAFFLEIDKRGNLADVLKSGWLQGEIHTVAKARLTDAEFRNQPMIGVNVYAQPDEQLQEYSVSQQREIKGRQIQPLKPLRLAEMYENLRIRSGKLSSPPKAGLICLGELRDYKPRADFVTNFLAAGGIIAEWSGDCYNLTDVQLFVEKTQTDYVCLCGTDQAYEELAEKIGKWMKENYPRILIDIAGEFSTEKKEQFHIHGTVFQGQNAYNKLNSLINRWEGKKGG